ncbi:hypothetical protein BJ742DRAFT_784975 [Cladochytrium replicatum]|nr:hypothetical protein BJ742DRAFT_784975 [Cladochytrium replicatum]
MALATKDICAGELGKNASFSDMVLSACFTNLFSTSLLFGFVALAPFAAKLYSRYRKDDAYEPVLGSESASAPARSGLLDRVAIALTGLNWTIYAANLAFVVLHGDFFTHYFYSGVMGIVAWTVIWVTLDRLLHGYSLPLSTVYTSLLLRVFYVVAIVASIVQLRLQAYFDLLSLALLPPIIEFWTSVGLYLIETRQRYPPPPKPELKDEDIVSYDAPMTLQDSPELKANLWSRAWFFWMDPMINTANDRILQPQDVNDLADVDKCGPSWAKYKKVKAASKPRTHFIWLLIKTTPLAFTYQMSAAFVSSILSIASPILLRLILTGITLRNDDSDETDRMVFLYIILLFVAATIRALADGQSYFNGRRISTQWRSIISSELYLKSLRRVSGAKPKQAANPAAAEVPKPEESDNNEFKPDPEAAKEDEKKKEADAKAAQDAENEAKGGTDASLGQLVNLQSQDTQAIIIQAAYVHDPILRLPLSVILTLITLFWTVGPSALVGLSIMIVSGPLATFIATFAGKVQEAMMAASDKRVTLINEVLQNIRIVKYFGWMDQFEKKIGELRAAQIRQYWRMFWVFMGMNMIGTGSSIFVAIATIITYVTIGGGTLNPAVAFTAIALLKQTSNLLNQLPYTFMSFLQCKVSVDRIARFLGQEELEELETPEPPAGETVPTIGFVNATFTYHIAESEEDTKKDNKEKGKKKATPPPSDAVVVDVNGDSDSTKEDEGFKLKNLNVGFPIGGLTVVCGPTGAGKSSLLLALLGEMKRVNGYNYLPKHRNALDGPGGVALVAQTAWLVNASIKDNILFGAPYEEERYRQVIEACALVKDFANLDSGDETEIGEKGVNISGGQKQRISLARGAYSRSSIVLLDDPLSAVDAPTAKHLFKYCILKFMAGRTRILVSHNVALVSPSADFLVLMKGGEIVTSGTVPSIANEQQLTGLPETVVGSDIAMIVNAANSSGYGGLTTDEEGDPVPSKPADDGKKGPARKLVQDEERAKGAVALWVYYELVEAAGGARWLFYLVASLTIVSFSTYLSDWWLKEWSEASAAAVGDVVGMSVSGTFHQAQDVGVLGGWSQLSTVSAGCANMYGCAGASSVAQLPAFASVSVANHTATSPGMMFMTSTVESFIPKSSRAYGGPSVVLYATVYLIFGILTLATDTVNQLLLFLATLNAARLHGTLVEKIIGAPLSFFEATPVGRILNRFSRDVSVLDNEALGLANYLLQFVLLAVTTIVIVVGVVPPFLILVPIMGAVFVSVAKSYLECSRELQRLDSVSKSPIYALFSETLTGVTTIRAYGQQERFILTNSKKLDTNHRFYFFNWAANRWLMLRTDMMSASVTFISGLFILLGGIPAGWAGLCLTYAMSLSDMFLWIIRFHAQLELSMNSIERILEYTKIEQEPPAIIEGHRPPADWPKAGHVKVEDLVVRYAADLPPVLSNVSFELQPGERCGIVGRTGAGKSTLSLAFFRILKLVDGKVEIDGLNIFEIGIKDLRTKISIVPQDPILFSGTLREALDPLGEHSDAAIWQVLKRTHFIESMLQTASTAANGNGSASVAVEDNVSITTAVGSGNVQLSEGGVSLDMIVSEGAGNFSVGQRQLLCIARAVLRRSKVVFLDEATASIDNELDTKIQRIIREELGGATLLTIAHRLKTIIDFDKVLVLDHGSVVEFGTPHQLLQDEYGTLRSMALETGEFDELVAIARSAYEDKFGVIGGSYESVSAYASAESVIVKASAAEALNEQTTVTGYETTKKQEETTVVGYESAQIQQAAVAEYETTQKQKSSSSENTTTVFVTSEQNGTTTTSTTTTTTTRVSTEYVTEELVVVEEELILEEEEE